MFLALKRLRVRGYKSLQKFDLRVPGRLLILVGPNGSGKSSLLQAMTFLHYYVKGNPDSFFEDRSWSPLDVRCRLESWKAPIGINVHIVINDKHVAWAFNWSPLTGETEAEVVWLQRKRGDLPIPILNYSKNLKRLDIGDTKIAGIRAVGSVLSIVETNAYGEEVHEVLAGLRQWALGVFSLELLSPLAMRRGNRGAKTDIGPRGENLGGFLAALDPQKSERIIKRLRQFYPIEDLETTRKKAGWIEIKVLERYGQIGKVPAAHMSDGFMRLLGIASIPEFSDDATTVLLDEIEDGIDPHILPNFVKLVAEESRAQIIMTSHSPVLVNMFAPEQICFVGRAVDGKAISAGFHEIREMSDDMEYLGAGEIWAQTSIERITELVRGYASGVSKDLHSTSPNKRTAAESVLTFMEP